ncbi:MAG: hypothetical protein HND58_07185 [Planctomycetota bacterium]|nr:MAG: hypothetical protein HND58_07185 [Planctomycetota bacterium]
MQVSDLKHTNTHLASILGIDDPLDEIGIHLSSVQEPYPATPRNATVFASSGVDGVHYVLLHLPERRVEDAPVIEVSPMDADARHCVGDNLHEFLEIMCQRHEEFIHHTSPRSTPPGAEPHDALRVIAALRTHLNLAPRPDHEPRCKALTALHLPRMQLNPE